MGEHLYQLADQYKFLEMGIEGSEEEQAQLQLDLAEVKAKIDDKVENIGKFVLSLSADTDAIKAEEERLSSRRKAIDNRIGWLKNYLLQEMVVAKVDKVQRDVLTVSIRANPPSVNVLSLDDIPAEYRRVIPETWQPDKKTIIDHFKDTGEIVSGVEMVTDKKSIVIK